MITHHNSNNQSSRITYFRVIRQISYTNLFKKYTSGTFSYFKILANHLIYNGTCRIVAKFKDYLIFDDNTEFIRRFYSCEESKPRLQKILTFYETYSKIFPNYMILKESKYLYRNIRKKQKMIDAVNEIKREEEENRKKMEENKGETNNEINELFTKRVKEEIKQFQEKTTFEKYKNQFDSDNEEPKDNSISISFMDRKKFFDNLDNKKDCDSYRSELGGAKPNSIYQSFVANETNHSISGILNVLNDNKIYIKDLPKLLEINNYSKNSQKLKNNKKKQNKELWKKHSPQKRKITNNTKLTTSNKLNNKINKINEISSKQIINNHNHKNMNNSKNLIKNYLSKKESNKLSTPSSGTVFLANTEKNINDINQCPKIIIPKGNTVININNNYFEQIASSSLPMGYYNSHKLKIKKNNNNSNNTISNSNLRKTNSNLSYKNSKSNNFLTEKKKQFKNIMNNINDELIIRNNNKKHHYKQISQDYIYQKNKRNGTRSFNKNEKIIQNNQNLNKFKLLNIKYETLSPQPTLNNVDTYQNETTKNQKSKNSLSKEKFLYKHFYTENNDPNLITRNTNGNEEENDNKEREKLILHIRDLIEKNNKEKINNDNNNKPFFSNKKNKFKIKYEIEKKYHSNTFSNYKTISNFNKDNSNLKNKDNNKLLEEKCFSNKEIVPITNENLVFNNKISDINKGNTNNNNPINNNQNEEIKRTIINKKFGFKKLPLKQMKHKTKSILKNNNLNNNYYNTVSNINKERNQIIIQKTNNNLKNHKYLLTISNQDNNLLKSTNTNNNKLGKKIKLLNKKYNQTLKPNKSGFEIPSKKVGTTLNQSLQYKSPNFQETKIIKFQKNEKEYIPENNTNTKIYYKGKIKNMKYKKDHLNIDLKINNTCYTHLNNYCSENFSNKAISSENNNLKNNQNNKENKSLTNNNKIDNSDLRNKYKNLLLKKYKQKSCEIENQSAIQNKMSKELLIRMSIIKQNNKNNFYQTYKENKVKLGRISNNRNHFESFDNLTNSNSNMYSLGNIQNYSRNSAHIEQCACAYQTPSIENKKLGLYKKINWQKPQLINTDKKIDNGKEQKYETPSAIKVNRAKFLGKIRDKYYDNNNNNKMNTMINFNSRSYNNF